MEIRFQENVPESTIGGGSMEFNDDTSLSLSPLPLGRYSPDGQQRVELCGVGSRGKGWREESCCPLHCSNPLLPGPREALSLPGPLGPSAGPPPPRGPGETHAAPMGPGAAPGREHTHIHPPTHWYYSEVSQEINKLVRTPFLTLRSTGEQWINSDKIFLPVSFPRYVCLCVSVCMG